MDQREAWNPLVVFLAGVVGLSFLVRPAPAPKSAAEARPQAAPPSLAVVPAVFERRAAADWLRDSLPVLRLLAELLGVPDDQGTVTLSTPQGVATLALLQHVDEALAKRPIDCARLAADARRAATDVLHLTRTEGKGVWPELLPHAQATAEAARLFCGARAIADADGVKVRFVIATLPDYVDGNSGWDADQRIEAIQRAAADAGYASDRFYLPDWTRDRPAGEPSVHPKSHDVEPGGLLFRRYRMSRASRTGEEEKSVLVVLFATETATTGVHGDALLSAVALASAWSPGQVLRLIAPSYSGSSVSLRAALDKALANDLLPSRVEIVSGSVTGFWNRARLTRSAGPKCVGKCPEIEFHSTTATDHDHLCAVEDYLSRANPGWKAGRGVAILREANTGYGGDLARGAPDVGCPSRFPLANVFSFPLHISRLRAQAATLTASAPGPGALVRLKLDEAAGADRVPSLAPELSSAMAEIVLGNILDGIERLGVGAVGIYATDKRDHLFLAQEISRRVPAVALFALEGNLVYLHQDYRSYLRGTLVIGSYPLFFPTQSGRDRNQFPSMAAAGIYNALIAQLAEGPRAQALLDRMVDYGDCGGVDGPCGPSVWIGMVGRDAIWPVRRVSRRDLAEQRLASATSDEGRKRAADILDYSWPRPLNDEDGRERHRTVATLDRYRLPRTSALIGLLILLAAGFLCIPWLVRRALAWRALPPGPRQGLVQIGRSLDMLYPPDMELPWRLFAAAPSGDRLAGLRREHVLGSVACAGATLCAGFWMATALLATYATLPRWAWQSLQVTSWLAVGVLAIVAGRALQPPPRHDRPSRLRRAFVTIPVLATLVAFGASAPSPRLMGELSTLNGLRFLTLSSLVSPTTPVVFITTAIMAWGVWRLRQIQLQTATLGAGSTITDLSGRTLPSGGLALVHELNHPYLHAGPWGLGMVALAAITLGTLGWEYRYTGEGAAGFGFFLWAGAILVTVLIGFTLTHSMRLGELLLAGTRALERHPLRLAFGTVHKLGLAWRYTLSPPGTEVLAPLVRQSGALARAIRQDAARAEGRADRRGLDERVVRRQRATDSADGPPVIPLDDAWEPVSHVMRIRAGDVKVVLSAVETLERLGPEAAELATPAFFHASLLWPRLEAVSLLLQRSLERGSWTTSPYPAEAGAGPPAPPRLATHMEAETFLALQVSCVIQLVLARLLSGLTLVIGGLVLLLSAHLFYSFPGRPFWLEADAILIAAATLLIVRLLVRLEKDAILSRLWGTRPGRIDWSGGLSFRMTIYLGVALLTVLASFFPEVAASLTQWVEPVRKALP